MPKKGIKQRGKCRVCIAYLMDNGKCAYNCDPSLARSGTRARHFGRGHKEQDWAPSFSAAEREKMKKTAQRLDPNGVYGVYNRFAGSRK